MDTPLLLTPAITDTIQPPVKAIEIWMKMTPAITDSVVVTNITDFIVLTLDKADILNFS